MGILGRPAVIIVVTASLIFGAGVTIASFDSGATNAGNHFAADALDPPTNVSAQAGTQAGTIDLSWAATPDAYASGYHLFRSTTAGGPYGHIADITSPTITDYEDTGLTTSQSYYYVIQSFYLNWESVRSDEATATAP